MAGLNVEQVCLQQSGVELSTEDLDIISKNLDNYFIAPSFDHVFVKKQFDLINQQEQYPYRFLDVMSD